MIAFQYYQRGGQLGGWVKKGSGVCYRQVRKEGDKMAPKSLTGTCGGWRVMVLETDRLERRGRARELLSYPLLTISGVWDMASMGLCKIFRRGVENMVTELRTEEQAGARVGSRPEP